MKRPAKPPASPAGHILKSKDAATWGVNIDGSRAVSVQKTKHGFVATFIKDAIKTQIQMSPEAARALWGCLQNHLSSMPQPKAAPMTVMRFKINLDNACVWEAVEKA